jgi:hypothetical protein
MGPKLRHSTVFQFQPCSFIKMRVLWLDFLVQNEKTGLIIGQLQKELCDALPARDLAVRAAAAKDATITKLVSTTAN